MRLSIFGLFSDANPSHGKVIKDEIEFHVQQGSIPWIYQSLSEEEIIHSRLRKQLITPNSPDRDEFAQKVWRLSYFIHFRVKYFRVILSST